MYCIFIQLVFYTFLQQQTSKQPFEQPPPNAKPLTNNQTNNINIYPSPKSNVYKRAVRQIVHHNLCQKPGGRI